MHIPVYTYPSHRHDTVTAELHEAARKNQITELQELLLSKADINERSNL